MSAARRAHAMSARYALIRLLLFIVGLPFAIAVLIPWWLGRVFDVSYAAPAGLIGGLAQAAGVLVIAFGIWLFATSLREIARNQQDTLTPWDPPRRLVICGPYQRVRNPLVSGVLFALFGQALLLQSLPHLLWAAAFLIVCLLYIPLLEEPQLEARFGEEYRRYRQHVSRFLPRLKPWKPEASR